MGPAVTLGQARRRAAVASVALLASWPVLAGAPAAPSAATAMSPSEARSQLLRMHAAATQRNYQGTLMVSASGQMSSSRVTHFAEGSQSYERLELLDGQTRQVLRHNDQVITLWPGSKRARIEQRDTVAMFPAVVTGSDDQLPERYDMIAEGSARVAGHAASVYLLRPRDNLRFAQRLWAEQGSGLLLRADVLAADGHVLETAAFTDVTIGVRAQPDVVLLPMKRLEGYAVTKVAPQRTSLDAEGWRLPVPVAGFREVSCVKRHLERNADEASTGPVLQSIYSDGLTHVSVFIEPLRGDRQRVGHGAVGATHTLMLAQGPYAITVMGDVPMATLKQFAGALERRR
jgi:sigma-E factor negative regulatory protein RseB